MNKVKKLNPIWRIIDMLMTPVMFIIGGFKLDSMQESHQWHVYSAHLNNVDKSKCAEIHGDDDSWLKRKYFFVFHLPIIGGWKKYVVLKAENNGKPWHVAWSGDPNLKSWGIHMLPIYDDKVRLLKGADGGRWYATAFDSEGKQLPLKSFDEGRLGDDRYKHVRLF